jgi:hypothetical protein
MLDASTDAVPRSGAELTVRPFHPDDETRVIDLLRIAHGTWPIVEGSAFPIDPVAFFRWKHRSSPFGKSLIVAAERDGELAGLRAFMPWLLQAGGRTIWAVRPVDAVTRPGLQRAGIFGRIREGAASLLPDDVDLHFGTANAKSLGAATKTGEGVVVGALCTASLLRPAATVSAALGRNGDGAPAIEAQPAGEVLDEEPAVPGLIEDAQRLEERLATARDARYLRWRYGDAPLDYRAVCHKRRGELRAIAIFRACSHHGLWEAVVEELIVRPDDRRAAVQILRQIAHAGPFGLLSCRFPDGTAQRSAARRLGFVYRRTGMPLLVGSTRAGIEPSPDRLDSWALALGDVDVL